MDTTPVLQETEVYCWEGPKAGMTLKGAQLGTLVLTPTHLVFLSSGGNDLGRRVAGAAIGGAAGGMLAGRPTGDLDLSALERPGSFAARLDQVEAEARSRWDRTRFLAVRVHAAGVAPVERALMGKAGLRTNKQWVAGIESGRAALPR